jgi:hypothetical protein
VVSFDAPRSVGLVFAQVSGGVAWGSAVIGGGCCVMSAELPVGVIPPSLVGPLQGCPDMSDSGGNSGLVGAAGAATGQVTGPAAVGWVPVRRRDQRTSAASRCVCGGRCEGSVSTETAVS